MGESAEIEAVCCFQSKETCGAAKQVTRRDNVAKDKVHSPQGLGSKPYDSILPFRKPAHHGLNPVCLLHSMGWDPVFQESPADPIFWAPDWDQPLIKMMLRGDWWAGEPPREKAQAEQRVQGPQLCLTGAV